MDCGPAALKSLLDGFRIPVSYGRLREACHTDVDGTSIDTVEEVAREAGLDAEQVMLPLDHVLLSRAATLPAVVVVRSASGGAHFVVAWRLHGPIVQVMDPSRGRLWMRRQDFIDQLFVHSMSVSAAAWRAWAGSEAFLQPLRTRLRAIGLSRDDQQRHIASAVADSSWRALATLDAGTRMVAALRSAKALRRSQAPIALAALIGDGVEHSPTSTMAIADQYWSVRPATPADDTTERLNLRGAVMVRVTQPLHARDVHAGSSTFASSSVSRELAAAFNEPPVRPLRHLIGLLRGDAVAPTVALLALTLAVVGVVFEATLLRSALDIGAILRGPGQALWAGTALATFAAALLSLEMILAHVERRLGSRLEGRLRVAFLDKIPRLADAYFQSRPVSDMLERSHSIHTVRMLPRLGVRFLRVGLELIVTTLALAWLNPGTASLALLAAAAAAGIPLLGHAAVAERDLRTRTHAGALARFHLDALRGRTPIEAHGAASTLEKEHEGLLAEWAAAAGSLQQASMRIEGIQMLVGFGLAAWMILGHLTAATSGVLLLQVYWMLNLPTLGYELALIAREYPAHRSTILRLLEPLGAPEFLSRDRTAAPTQLHNRVDGVSVHIRQVHVRLAGHTILEEIDTYLEPGTHVAVVGSSGAGKSTLAGLLLGWHRPASGDILIDGEPLTHDRLEALRAVTAWVDPTIQIWNRSLLDNLLYGSEGATERIGSILEKTGLLSVVAKLPEGLATPLGEGGALLSAGEAQRVRLGRAMLKSPSRLVILDEPFIGLERDRRRALLTSVRQHWRGRTMLYVTHDVVETRAFDRVLVVEHGRIVEDGDPRQLGQTTSSRYRWLLQAYELSQSRFAGSAEWRRVRLDAGRIVHEHARANEQTA